MRPNNWQSRFLIIVVAYLLLLFPQQARGEPTRTPDPTWKLTGPSLSAGAAVLMDWRTGQVLFERNAFRRRDPASTTKVLTALIALERAHLNDQVKISRRASLTPGSSMYVKQGETYSLHDLLHGLLLRSGNDAAVAIAEHVSGSVEAFAKLMTERAQELGAKDSHFANPHGLTDPQHWTTAYDLALITRTALRNPTFAAVVALRERPLSFEYLDRDVVLHNTNRLLHIMPEADGVKTGTTAAAGACLVASATRADQKLIAVLLHDGNRWNDSARLLQWGFTSFQLAFMGKEGEVLRTVPVKNGKVTEVPLRLVGDLPVVTPRTSKEAPTLTVQLNGELVAPLKKGQMVGRATASHGKIIYASTELMVAQDVPKASLFDKINRSMQPLLHWLTRVMGI
jgi:D-alanyl-D-alanine carboxypeptidase (penicillin-binding protein 5/6)